MAFIGNMELCKTLSCACARICACARMCARVSASVHMYVYVCVCVCACVHGEREDRGSIRRWVFDSFLLYICHIVTPPCPSSHPLGLS